MSSKKFPSPNAFPKHYIPKGAIDQDVVFYNRLWTKEIDTKFADVLFEQHMIGNFQARSANAHPLLTAKFEVNKMFGTDFDYSYCLDRMRNLHKRYRVFNKIINHEKVDHNEVTHKVRAPQSVWEKLCREEKLAMAYMEKGEELYDGLHEKRNPKNHLC